MKLYNLKETSKETGLSRPTIYRYYQDHPDLWEETKIVNKKRLIPEAHLNSLTKTNIYAKAFALGTENEQLKRLVRLLSKNDTMEYKLYSMDWDYFGTIAFKNVVPAKTAYHKMLQAFDYIITMYGKEIGVRIFFTVEPFSYRDGTHIHFILKVGKGLLTDAVIAELKDFFKGNRIEFKKYDMYKAGLFYIAKEGLKGEDWDFLGNDLYKFGNNENKGNAKAI